MRLRAFLLALLLSGCADPEPARIDRSDLDLDACVDGLAGVRSLSPAVPVDYLELRSEGGWMSSVGERCGGASDAAGCEEAYADLLPPDPWYPTPGGGAPPPGEYLVFTRGDEVSAVGASGLAAFLAPVDTPAEAAFLAQVATQGSVDCTIPSAAEVDGGYEIYLVRTQPCGGQVVELRVFVSETAETSVVEQVTVNEGEDIICP